MPLKDNYSIILLAFVLAILLPGCAQAPAAKTASPATQPAALVTATPEVGETQAAIALDTQSLKNLEYQLGIIGEAQAGNSEAIKLTNGSFEQPIQNSSAKLQVNYIDSAVGDLNGDGFEDAAVILAVNTGGSGTFMQLAGVLNQNGRLMHVDTADLGDRTKIKSIRIEDGIVKVETIVHSSTDPQCCPSLDKLQEFVLQNGRLLRQETQ